MNNIEGGNVESSTLVEQDWMGEVPDFLAYRISSRVQEGGELYYLAINRHGEEGPQLEEIDGGWISVLEASSSLRVVVGSEKGIIEGVTVKSKGFKFFIPAELIPEEMIGN